MKNLPELKKVKPGTMVLEPYEHLESSEKLDHYSTPVLLEQLDEILQVKKPYEEQENIDYNTAKQIEVILSNRMGFPIQRYYSEDLAATLNTLVDKMNTVIAIFKNHRHSLDKTYGEKPVW